MKWHPMALPEVSFPVVWRTHPAKGLGCDRLSLDLGKCCGLWSRWLCHRRL